MQLAFGLTCGAAVLYAGGKLLADILTLSGDAIVLLAVGVAMATIFLIVGHK